jgi:hypothetical protein
VLNAVNVDFVSLSDAYFCVQVGVTPSSDDTPQLSISRSANSSYSTMSAADAPLTAAAAVEQAANDSDVCIECKATLQMTSLSKSQRKKRAGTRRCPPCAQADSKATKAPRKTALSVTTLWAVKKRVRRALVDLFKADTI